MEHKVADSRASCLRKLLLRKKDSSFVFLPSAKCNLEDRVADGSNLPGEVFPGDNPADTSATCNLEHRVADSRASLHPSSSQLEKLHLFQIAFPGETSPVHLEKLHLDKLHLETPPLPNQSFARTKAHTTSQSHPVAEVFLHVLLFERLSVVIRGEERLPSVCPWVVLKERRVLPKEIPPEAQAPPERWRVKRTRRPSEEGELERPHFSCTGRRPQSVS